MKKRWKDRIEILLPNQPSYDEWGHQSTPSFNRIATVWANVCPLLGKNPMALVTVRMPFEFDQDITIQWQERQWRIIQGPTYFPSPRLAQFKIEQR